MFARRRPLLRAAVVGGGAYAMGKHSARREAAEGSSENAAMYGSVQDQRATGQPVATSSEPSVSDQLTQLSRLHQEGALSDDEFAAAKSRLLGS
jgi:putative oligomerization/nucleic acid binding protein